MSLVEWMGRRKWKASKEIHLASAAGLNLILAAPRREGVGPGKI
jgi:hypothetical protein